jgi:HTH-type transcriptional regulator/antitoxin HigA
VPFEVAEKNAVAPEPLFKPWEGPISAFCSTAIHYNRRKVYIRAVLTHGDYDKGEWKE